MLWVCVYVCFYLWINNDVVVVIVCEFEPRSWWDVLDTTLCGKVCQGFATSRWFSPGSPVSSSNKTVHHDIIQILLNVALNTMHDQMSLERKVVDILVVLIVTSGCSMFYHCYWLSIQLLILTCKYINEVFHSFRFILLCTEPHRWCNGWMPGSCAVDYVFEIRSGQTKDYTIGICCISAKHITLRKNNKDCLARNQHNMPVWADMSICGMFHQWTSSMKIQQSVLV